jgi:hypothetical protein
VTVPPTVSSTTTEKLTSNTNTNTAPVYDSAAIKEEATEQWAEFLDVISHIENDNSWKPFLDVYSTTWIVQTSKAYA